MNKSIFKSRTFWINLIAFVIAAFGIITPDLYEPLLKNPETTALVGKWLIGAQGLLNIALRLMTKDPVSILPTDDE